MVRFRISSNTEIPVIKFTATAEEIREGKLTEEIMKHVPNPEISKVTIGCKIFVTEVENLPTE